MVMVAVAWVAATPLTLRRPRLVQRVGFALIGPLQRLFEHVDAKPGEYSEEDISSYFWLNGAFPQTEGYRRLFDSGFADYRLRIHGLVEHEARWVVLYSLGDGPEGGLYYEAHPIEQMRNRWPWSPTT
jgi:methionine sulfoxide reductase catalytic subunit